MRAFLFSSVMAVLACLLVVSSVGAAKPKQSAPVAQMKVDGEVTEIKSGLIFVTTPFARYTIPANTAPPDAKVGDQVTLWVNKDNIVIDHHRKGTEGVHRFVTGKLVYVGRTKKEIKLLTPEGAKVFPLERLEVKARDIQEGALVTVQLREDGTVIDLYRASVDTQVPAQDAKEKQHGVSHLVLDGVVTDIRSGLMFIKTPFAQYTISMNSAPHDAKVGDKVTLWVDKGNLVVDHHRKGTEGVHRFITGNLNYVGRTKKEIKLMTPEGAKVFPLERLEVKAGGIEDGALVTVELNEEGTVIDVRRADSRVSFEPNDPSVPGSSK